MDNRLKKYVAPLNSSIKETLQIIDANKKGFALITDEDCLVGVATGGDIRWALLRGSDFDSSVNSAILEAKVAAKYVSKANGGEGAIREIIEQFIAG